ncbi:hypothetical protein QTP86_030910 [Hemibagrus guttatus]|nr:hypothetical protein QTP86_030910 [Hemibagrus guttatus]
MWRKRKRWLLTSGEHRVTILDINWSNMEIVKSTKFLGVHLAEDLTWLLNTSSITKKVQQRLYFLRRLRKAHLPPLIMTVFYRGTIESILSSCITAWFENCTVSYRKTLERILIPLTQQQASTVYFHLLLQCSAGLSGVRAWPGRWLDPGALRVRGAAFAVRGVVGTVAADGDVVRMAVTDGLGAGARSVVRVAAVEGLSRVCHGEHGGACWFRWGATANRPRLTTTAIGAVDLQGAGGNWATVGRRSRGGKRVRRQREKRKGKSVGLRIGTLNVGTMTGKGRELADMMERRKVDILCVQEIRWKGSKARSIGARFKLFYYGVDSKRNGVGVVLKEEFVRNVLEVKKVSDRVMSLKLEIEGVMLNVVSGYAPQVGCELEEKERFWSELDEVMESIPTGERVVIGADFNGHVGEGNTGDEEVMGKFGVKERNLEGQMVVDFAKRMDMGVVNTYFQKREEHRVTYKSGGRRTQVDYILCRRGNLKEISDCKVVVGESVARQHRMVVCRMTLMVCKKKRSKIEIEKKTKLWKLKKEECCEEFRQKLRQALGGQVCAAR